MRHDIKALVAMLLLMALALLPGLAQAQLQAQSAAAATAAALDPDVRPMPLPPEQLVELGKARMKRMNLNPLGTRISRYQEAAVEAMDAGESDEALALLEKLNPKRLNPHERAVLYRLTAYVAYDAGSYEPAIVYFRKAIAEEVLPLEAEVRMRFNIAQLQAALQDWAGVVAAIDDFLIYVPEPDPLAFYLKGIAYFQLEDLEKARKNVEYAVDVSPEPPESWLQLLAATYVRVEDYPSASSVLEELVMRFPKKQYWVQLSLIYGARDDYRHSLAVQQLAYEQGLLTEDAEIRRLARSYLFHNMPYSAARLVEKSLADGTLVEDAQAYELLANSWLASREFDKSFVPLQKAAALADTGDLYVRLGQVHMQREEWPEAAEQFQKAIAKGELKQPGNAELLLGISYYNAANFSRARSYFKRATQYEKTRKQARQWIAHIEKEEAAG